MRRFGERIDYWASPGASRRTPRSLTRTPIPVESQLDLLPARHAALSGLGRGYRLRGSEQCQANKKRNAPSHLSTARTSTSAPGKPSVYTYPNYDGRALARALWAQNGWELGEVHFY